MVNLITKTDFIAPYNIVADTPALEARLNGIITTYQPIILRKILGELEYAEFDNDFSGGVPASSHWLNFLNGTTWDVTRNGKTVTVNFAGIKPILAKMIYYYSNEATMTAKMQSGEGQMKFQNSTQVPPDDLIIRAWNEACYQIGMDPDLSDSELEEYIGTVYNYLDRNSDLFPNWEFNQPKRLNFLGI
jgi:hypothetical protein